MTGLYATTHRERRARGECLFRIEVQRPGKHHQAAYD